MSHDGALARAAGAVAALAIALSAAHGRAQALDETQRRAVAQALFDEAQKLMAANSYSVACIKLEEVVRLQPGKIGAILTLARCYEGEGKTASAWSRYKNVADTAKIAGDGRETEAQKKVVELESKVPKLSISVDMRAGAVAGLSVKRDGIEVSAAQWGVAIPMDPGEHHIEVTAPGRQPWVSEATLVDGRVTTVEVPELSPEGAAPLPSATAKPTLTVPPATTLAPSAAPPGGDGKLLGLERRAWGLIAGGVGAAGLVAGGITGGLALSQHDALASTCAGGACPPSKRGEVNAYETVGMVSTVSFIAGGVFAAAGVALWLTAPRPKSAGVRLIPYAGPGGAGVVGKF